MITEAFRLPSKHGARLCLLHRPDKASPVRGAVLFVHGFAEEMNKCRRMTALQARHLADLGFVVLQPDLFGCGDSDGDFGDIAWSDWLADVLMAHHWLQEQAYPTIWLWGVRTGCLLVAEAAQQLPGPTPLLLWQPVLAGKQFLQQFMRLQSAGQMLGKSVANGAQAGSREAGLELAGYRLAPALLQGLEQARLTPPALPSRLLCFQLLANPDMSAPPALLQCLALWQQAGWSSQLFTMAGPAFWQSSEIEECPALLTACSAAMLEQTVPA